MTSDDDVYVEQPTVTRRPGRKAAISVVGLAVVLGGGAYLVTSQVRGGHDTSTKEPGVLAPLAPTSADLLGPPPLPSTSSSKSPSLLASMSAASPASTTPRAKPSPSKSESVREQIEEARSQAAREGHPLQHALTPKLTAAAKPNGTLRERDEQIANGKIKILTARYDLTGQEELMLPADNGEPVGDAHCTQNIHFSANAPPKTIPTFMICWRTSADRSVVTMAVTKTGSPSAASSASIIDREWVKLG